MVLEKALESPLDSKKIQPVHPKINQSWIFIGRTDAEAETPILCEELTHWKRPWCWERLKVGGEGDDGGWGGWVASPTQWPWVWVSSGSWRWTGKPVVLQSMRSQRVGLKQLNWATELNWQCLHGSYTIPFLLLGWLISYLQFLFLCKWLLEALQQTSGTYHNLPSSSHLQISSLRALLLLSSCILLAYVINPTIPHDYFRKLSPSF